MCFAEPTLAIKVGPLVLEFDVLDVYEISLSLVRGIALAAIGKKTTPAWALSMWQTSNLFWKYCLSISQLRTVLPQIVDEPFDCYLDYVGMVWGFLGR